jgi:thiaminase/transcriptional activator TenA
LFYNYFGGVEMKNSERIFALANPIWEKCFEHPFVKGIADGTLNIERFRFYMVQDHLYLMQYAKLFALGLIKSQKEKDIRLFASLISDTLDTENAVHREYLKTLGITREMIDQTKTALVTESYTNYMLSVGFSQGVAEISAAVLACSWSYKIIGDWCLANSKNKNKFFSPWIDEYTSESYNHSNDVIIDFIDKLTEKYTEEQMLNIENIVTNCSRYELQFWDMAWNMEY